MPRQKPRKGKNGAVKAKTNGTTRKKRGKGSGAWTPQRRGTPEAWMKKLGYTPAALRCRTLADMSEEEILAIEQEYGVPVIRPGSSRSKGRRNARPLVESPAHATTQDWW
jgi:hypothetical protein